MTSNIDTTVPPFGNPTTAAERSNWSIAKSEISTLQSQSVTKIGDAPSDGQLYARQGSTGSWVVVTGGGGGFSGVIDGGAFGTTSSTIIDCGTF